MTEPTQDQIKSMVKHIGKWLNTNPKIMLAEDNLTEHFAEYVLSIILPLMEALGYGLADDEMDNPNTTYGAWRIHAREALDALRKEGILE